MDGLVKMLTVEWRTAHLETGGELGWTYRVRERIARGREIANSLRDIMTAKLPDTHSELEDAWRQAFELSERIQAAVGMLWAWQNTSGF